MNPVCCSIYDKKAQAFLAPVFYTDLITSERAYIQFLAAGNSTPAQWPEDFDLYHLGSVNPATGELIPLEHPALVITGQSAMLAVSRLRRGGSELSRGGEVIPPSEDSEASAERNKTPTADSVPADDLTPDLFV